MSIYEKNGYIDMAQIFKHQSTFSFITGARGTGKSYGSAKFLYENCDENNKFIWLRRTEVESNILNSAFSNPFHKYFLDNSIDDKIEIEKIGKTGLIYINDKHVGFICALSTFANLRGADTLFSNVKYIFFDEFIASENKRKIKGEYDCFLNFYETVNRNRELEGQSAIKCVCASNSNELANPYYLGMECVEKVVNLQRLKQEKEYDVEKNVLFINIMKSPISDKKRKTAISKISTKAFDEMAFENLFQLDTLNVKSLNLKDFKPLVKYGELVIYIKKDNSCYYANTKKVGECLTIHYGSNESETYFRTSFKNIYLSFIFNENVFFENTTSKLLFKKAFE